MSSEPLLAHGLGKSPAAPEWPPLTVEETTNVLRRYGVAAASVAWRSPRPWSAAALVTTASGTVFVKRHHDQVRSAADLTVEHGFLRHLASHGIPVPDVLELPEGGTALELGAWVYEVQTVGAGEDLYRDALSWTPYRSESHASAAGEALALFHLAAASYPAPRRPGPPLLCSSARLIGAASLSTAMDAWLSSRPATAQYLSDRDGRVRLLAALGGPVALVADIWPTLPSSWSHHDWHGSNLLWSASGDVSCVIDVGLADRTGPVFDLATAIERSMIGWLELTDDPPGVPDVQLSQIDAFLSGYQAVRPLSASECRALPSLLRVAHVELALSEVEYYLSVRNDPASAELAYEGYLLGHLEFFAGAVGQELLSELVHLLARSAP